MPKIVHSKNKMMPGHKIHRLKIPEINAIIAFPKIWDKDEFQFTLFLPNIRPKPWHFSINVGLNKDNKDIFHIHAHWKNEETGCKEDVLLIYFSRKDLATLLPNTNIELYLNKFVLYLQQKIPTLLRRNLKIFNLLSRRDDFFLYYCGAISDEKEMLQQLFNYFPYEPSKKQVTLTTKLTSQTRKHLAQNLLNLREQSISTPGFYTGFLIHPISKQIFNVGYFNVEKVDENLIGFFLLKYHTALFGFNYLTIPFAKILEKMIEALLKIDSLTVKWYDKDVPLKKVNDFINNRLILSKKEAFENIIVAGLESQFWRKGYKFRFRPEFKWGIPFFVAYKRSARVLGALAYKSTEIVRRIEEIIVFKKKYKAKQCIFITPDKSLSQEILNKHKLNKVRILPLNARIFIKMFYDSLGIPIVKRKVQ